MPKILNKHAITRFLIRFIFIGLLPYLLLWSVLALKIGHSYPGYCDFGDGKNCFEPGLDGFVKFAGIPTSFGEVILGLLITPLLVVMELLKILQSTPLLEHSNSGKILLALMLAPYFALMLAMLTNSQRKAWRNSLICYLSVVILFSYCFETNSWTPTLRQQQGRGFCSEGDTLLCRKS